MSISVSTSQSWFPAEFACSFYQMISIRVCMQKFLIRKEPPSITHEIVEAMATVRRRMASRLKLEKISTTL